MRLCGCNERLQVFVEVSIPGRTPHGVATCNNCGIVGGLGTDRQECKIASIEIAFDEGFFWHFTGEKKGSYSCLNVSEVPDAWHIRKVMGRSPW